MQYEKSPIHASPSTDETIDTVASDDGAILAQRLSCVHSRRLKTAAGTAGLLAVVALAFVVSKRLLQGCSIPPPDSTAKMSSARGSAVDAAALAAASYPRGLSAAEYGSMQFSDAVSQFAGDEAWWGAAVLFEWNRMESSGDGETSRPFIVANDAPGQSGWQRGAPIRAYFGEGATESVLYNGEDMAAFVLDASAAVAAAAPGGLRVHPVTPPMKMLIGVTEELQKGAPAARSFRVQLCREADAMDDLLADLRRRAVDVAGTRAAWFWSADDGARRAAETHETPAAAREAMSFYVGALDAASGVAEMLQVAQLKGSGETIIVQVPPARTPEDTGNIVALLTAAACHPAVCSITYEHPVEPMPMFGRLPQIAGEVGGGVAEVQERGGGRRTAAAGFAGVRGHRI